MNKFNKIFRKSMAIGSHGGENSLSSSPPKSYSGSSGSGSSLNHSTGSAPNSHHHPNIQHYSSSPNLLSNTNNNNNNNNTSVSSGSLSSSPSSISASTSTSSRSLNNNIASTSIGSNGGGPSSNNLYSQYNPLPCIDFEQIFLPYIRDGDRIKNYFLVHSILSKKGIPTTAQGVIEHQQQHQNQDGTIITTTIIRNRSQSEQDSQSKSSWQPFYKKNSNVSFLVICSKNIVILDATSHPFTITKKISIGDIKEIVFETSDLGLFTIELNPNPHTDHSNPNLLFFTVGCEKKDIFEQLNQSFDEMLKDYYSDKNKDLFILKKCNMLSSVDQTYKKEFKNHVNQLLDEISMYGFTAQDLWEGNADLKFWVDKIKDKIEWNSDERFLVEFILPQEMNCKRVYRVPNDIPIKEIINFLCIKAQIIQDSSIFTLATIKGKELDEIDVLGDYGLGSFFDNWQLVLVEKGKTRSAGLFNLEVHFPDSPEYRGRYHRVLELDGYMCASKLVNYIGEQMEINKSHLYSIKLEIIVNNSNNGNNSASLPSSNSIVLEDEDYLTTHGLGSKFLKCKLKLIPKKLPKASKDKLKNLEVTKLIIDDIVENAWKEFNQRKQEKASIICNEIINSIIDTTVIECQRASTLSLRMASLSIVGRAAMYKILAQKEQEELNYYKLEGQKAIINQAKDLVNSLSPVAGPSSDVQLDDKTGSNSLHRVAPPPPPPILGFKNFKPKKKAIEETSSTSTPAHLKMNNPMMGLGSVDMNQILGMRNKLRSLKKPEEEDSKLNQEDRNKMVNFTLRNTKNIQKNQSNPVVTNETNELMQKLQKRHQAAALDAEDLGDS
ncbi:hypothetical protein DICPUDRAFT_156482 [Dictyostelium purpureum]|uniref:Uncharacterized protein n=1 Tax=Dictyostelium purpureum TaxID=5786 RepID=F0ZWP4_DICPU|nr:uncharacterized protein DICPUDRAFT_156482 [Dictyostelium purpureum]EGC31642.1 hypothetical protein DICPUDRAFT_156482 [Dictyostelium purpureum]|eukprot:XP_003291840.1 hypothetical protein DICPUDRAFT_156482 [Dictyostelium purpureum]